VVYQGDTRFSGGNTYTATAAIAGTNDDRVYQSERYGNFSYAIPVADGDYLVTLKFAEIYFTKAGQRVFDVTIEGDEVLTDLDLVAEAGPKVAYDQTFPVHVSDGTLNIGFHSVVNYAKVSAIVVEPVDVEFAVNAGGAQYVDGSGVVYQGDTRFSGGNTYTATAAIAGTNDDRVYQSERYGNFSYAIPVADGDYLVTLKFAEIYFTKAGQRVFDVTIEGDEVVTDLDLVAEVGPKVAYDQTFPVHVSDGTLNIGFHSVVDYAKVSAIVVMGVAAGF
jgi:hypothetical protein